MEHGLRVGNIINATKIILEVLILLLMEYALWVLSRRCQGQASSGLNPSFNGICSVRGWQSHRRLWVPCLNPSFNGICSVRIIARTADKSLICLNPSFNGICSVSPQGNSCVIQWLRVLILLLMEYALWDQGGWSVGVYICVLILLLMEYALWECPIWALRKVCYKS